ncbi:hypothetical protein [Nitrospira lenta]|uniref:Uncharacterized protein n=1 Tax=Nitrospira lenta TaxID=1436998 RepID=A0A330L1T5_9BACT|nr:hypothetical protein [Nitrospira lenta]SPP63287.1 exported hypothetical protein [Nitrospira lenta]
MSRAHSLLILLFLLVGFQLVEAETVSAQLMQESTATTEQSCSFGMGKGEPAHSCAVPFPPGCRVAQAPGSSKPWTTISTGGRLLCRFDDKQTDWKTKITGACNRCQSGQCSAQFSVRYDCSPQQ